MRPAVVIVFVALTLSACSQPLEFADWTIPVPEGARVIEYAAVPIEQRTERIEMVQDLVIGNDEDPDYRFYQPRGLSVGDDGTIYVLDTGNHRVQVFDQGGLLLASWGREGQGPGEFVSPGGIAIADGHVMVVDGGRRLSRWTLDGQHVIDRQIPRPILRLAGAGGPLVAFYTGVKADRSRHFVISSFSAEWDELLVLARFPRPVRARTPPGSIEFTQDTLNLESSPYPNFAVSPLGPVYVTFRSEYQVMAANASGQPEWALRAAWSRRPFTEQWKATRMESLRERAPEARESQLDWPEFQRALRSINVDGHGHVYVFPIENVPEGLSEEGLSPVDVYSASGARLFSGFAPHSNWSAAKGDYVYALANAFVGDDEPSVIRYRLVEPFE